MIIEEALSFDDVLLKPKFSDIVSRSEVDIGSILDDNFILELPIISAPMDTITEHQMAIAMRDNGGLGIIHRFNTIEQQVKELVMTSMKAGCSIGVSGDYLERAQELINNGCKLICVDVAHGHHVSTLKTLETLKHKFSNIHLMVGNVATPAAALDLAKWGADSIKVGIGGGSICSTRVMTGHGIPTLQSVIDINEACFFKNYFPKVKIIADGGIKTPGDIVKALAAGADFVMLGSMLAGTYETPGHIIEDYEGRIMISSNHKAKQYKVYRGMASEEAQISWRGKVSSKEGISAKVPIKGYIKDILNNIKINVSSGFSYSGARNIKELRERATFIKQTSAGITESSTHILNIGEMNE